MNRTAEGYTVNHNIRSRINQDLCNAVGCEDLGKYINFINESLAREDLMLLDEDNMPFEAIFSGALLAQGRLAIEPGKGRQAKTLPRNTTPEDVYDECVRREYAHIAVKELENLSTEGLLLLMRKCFIEGMKA